MKNFFICLLFICIQLRANAITDTLVVSNRVYNPNWSVTANGGSLPMNTLAPYVQVSEEDKQKKIPLVLVHGVISENRPYSNWKNFLDEADHVTNGKFFRKYNVYIYRYPTNSSSWVKLSGDLKTGLTELLADYPPNTPFKAVVSSMGGNLFCSAVERDSAINQRFSLGISLGTPFWGTPLLNDKLMTQRKVSTDRYINLAVASITDTLFPQLKMQLPWTLPIEKEKAQTSHNCEHLRNRIINYGGYLNSPIAEGAPDREIRKWLTKSLSSTDYRHAWDSAMHYKLGWEIENNFPPNYLLRFNDGLVPIFSSLWLKPEISTFKGETRLTPAIIKEIRKMNPRARLYAGLDHTDLTSTDNELDSPIYDSLQKSKKSIGENIINDLK